MELLVITVLSVAVIFAFVVLLARWVANGIRNAVSDALNTVGDAIHEPNSGGRSALEILDQRYARGEIGRDEYQRMRRDIEGAAIPPERRRRGVGEEGVV